jgi:peptide deformylase
MGATKMSEIISINTEEGITSSVKDAELDVLPVYPDAFPMLQEKVPEYKDALPSGTMTVLVKRLKMTMKAYNGLGLSANQCGVFERVFVMRMHDRNEIKNVACINPKIIDESDEIIRDKEGCLSYPGMFLTVPRSQWITASWYDENGQGYESRLDGIQARVFAHELDHLNGVKMTDYVGPVAVKMARDKQVKLMKKIKRQMKNGKLQNPI